MELISIGKVTVTKLAFMKYAPVIGTTRFVEIILQTN
jgi:hypothetical protein